MMPFSVISLPPLNSCQEILPKSMSLHKFEFEYSIVTAFIHLLHAVIINIIYNRISGMKLPSDPKRSERGLHDG